MKQNMKSSSNIETVQSNIASPYDPEREEILNKKITGITIGLTTLTPKTANAKYIGAIFLKTYVPHYVFPPALYHASILLHHGSLLYGTLIEYGPYTNDSEHCHPRKVHYWDHDGLRFVKMKYQEYKNYVNLDSFAFANSFHFFDCDIKHEFTVRELINYCMINKSWRAKDYSLEGHNCQSFVASVIQELQAYRPERSKRNHTYDKTLIPHRILEPLENIEGDIFSTIEKIPIAGTVIGCFKTLFYRISEL